MSRSAQQRVEDALSQLVERLVPTVDGEDETAADDRFYQAFDFAKETIGQADPPDVVPDQNHVADLIRRKRESLSVRSYAHGSNAKASRPRQRHPRQSSPVLQPLLAPPLKTCS